MRLTARTSRAVFGGAEETVYVGCRVIAVVYGALAVVQLALVPGTAKWVLATVSLLSAVAGVACARRLRTADAATVDRLVWVVCTVPFVNSVLFIAATGQIAPTMVMLSTVAIGAVATQIRPALVLTLLGVAAWGAAVLAWGPHPPGAVMGHAINLGLACALAFAVYSIRALTGERLRLAELRLTQRLEELDEARRQLEALSTTDQLTGCFNRRGWDDRVEALHRLARREDASLTLGIVDLDHFKEFNDSFGHRAGDELLSTFVRHASAAIRDVDVLARWGGDEFTVALYGCSVDEATAIFQRIGQTDAARTTCSIGFAQVHPGESLQDCLTRADHALYRAKRLGRDQVAHCSCEAGTAACHEDGQLTAAI
ncbi:MAG: diguanylate cyclase/phosphodiesterase (GGDEF & EAL domains) with PAS/PAC sensor(s) [uncultured Nocardioides sp.]|uniref:Diguanylate cyclase/phosphodiesterase (GGDEF & EAL domains) with PAS/PAC sensor(S) n=1 Tax=uncultured Nocardioides sp. TaxID=198441 RepID=A0A6J4N4M5_9ACTN|nr:MAG: diguanylate cyclase/phosphodiesterase (GGDEF & EAL domains) with PAS/PAC sensor(s) [uncultured Nocardioides sp.]